MCCKKGGHCGRQACGFWEMILPQWCSFQMDGLAYDSIPPLGLSLQSPIGFPWEIPWWYLDQQYINRKESLLLLFLYYHVFSYSFQHFTEQRQDTWKAAARDAAETQRRAAASASTWRSSKVMLGWVCSSKSKEGSGGEGPGGSWVLWNTLTLTFFFLFYLFFLILYFFSFEFLFLFLFLFSDDEEAHDIAVTWHVTWCDVISLEHSGKI